MNKYFLAIDIGASGGRHIIGWLENGQILGDAVAYRDPRTEGIEEEVFSLISEKELYERTGIQKQPFNTIYQLMALKKESPELLKSMTNA